MMMLLGRSGENLLQKLVEKLVSHLLLVELIKKEEKLAMTVKRSYSMKVFHFSKPVYRSLTCP